ncbi:hypothetical protein OBBRIDRAFT_796251 [Obba rivulosa]|uniref:Uncharacterized protein n=1 Tax=Obba rivulosa TaxID=1052685 RepID=A0A8E2AVH0_9APHY|nr:hypothetical protein OBBRIDRAFT_796251 [Obba rivulosa]
MPRALFKHEQNPSHPPAFGFPPSFGFPPCFGGASDCTPTNTSPSTSAFSSPSGLPIDPASSSNPNDPVSVTSPPLNATLSLSQTAFSTDTSATSDPSPSPTAPGTSIPAQSDDNSTSIALTSTSLEPSTSASLFTSPTSGSGSLTTSPVSVRVATTASSMLFNSAESASSTVHIAAAISHSNHAGAIAGGVIGSFAFLAAVLGAAFVLRRRHIRKNHVAPSAEFMAVAPRPGTGFGPADTPTPYEHDFSTEDLEQPPPFTPGKWTDPVYEKVQASAALQEQYSRSYDQHQAGASSAYEKSEGRMLLD